MNKPLQHIAQQFSTIQHEHYEVMHPCHGQEMLCIDKVQKMVDLAKGLMFPGFFGTPLKKTDILEHVNEQKLEQLQELLQSLIFLAFCFVCEDESRSNCCNKQQSERLTLLFLEQLPEINRVLISDVQATRRNDPAASGTSEIIFAYPGIKAIISHRIAHCLYKLEVPILPRIISELSHSATGIDIHPGAQIGSHFCIDHGTGTVIGQTAIIGRQVTIYQGVTLGAKRFDTDKDGNMLNTPRHPIVEDGVTIYAGAKILGRVTIGKDSVIGGNVWLTQSVPANSKITQFTHPNNA